MSDAETARADDAMAELLPCPFCGEQPKFTADDSHGACHVHCRCNAEPCCSAFKDEPGKAIAAWNTRHSAPAREVTGEMVARLCAIEDDRFRLTVSEGGDVTDIYEGPLIFVIRIALKRGLEVRALSATPAPARGREDGSLSIHDREPIAHRAALKIRPETSGDAEYWRLRGIVSSAIVEAAALSKPVLSAEVRDGQTWLRQMAEGVRQGPQSLDNEAAARLADMLRNLERDRNLVFDLVELLAERLEASGQSGLAFRIRGHFARATGSVGIPEIVGEIVRGRAPSAEEGGGR